MRPLISAEAERPLLEARIFSVGFAFATAFHVFGNPRLAPAWSVALLGAAAAALLWRPRSAIARSALAVMVLTTAWLEAPLLGNHWLLASLISLAWLLAAARGALRRADATDTWVRFSGAARLTLLVFYSFAAFAKLNADFFDPVVSCASFYFRESVGSFGLDALANGPTGWIDRAVIYGSAGVEASIPLLLALRRTRSTGVVVAIAFHLVLAVDRSHQFFDFSSILTALFLLFASTEVQRGLMAQVDRVSARVVARWESGPELGRLLAVIAVASSLALPLGPRTWPLSDSFRSVGLAVFWVGAGLVLAVVARETWRTRDRARSHVALGTRRVGWLLLVPALAFANGLTPYTEVKTGYGWNMYSNLRTVDGESNHFIVRSTLPLTDQQSGLVRIIETSDFSLAFYARFDYLLPFDRFRNHLADRPDVSVEFERNGEVFDIDRVGDHPDLMRRLPEVERKLLLFRAVDARSRERCQQGFGPVR